MGENYALKNFKAFYMHYKHFNVDQIRPNRETDIDRENQGWLLTLMVDIESEKLRILEGTPTSIQNMETSRKKLGFFPQKSGLNFAVINSDDLKEISFTLKLFTYNLPSSWPFQRIQTETANIQIF